MTKKSNLLGNQNLAERLKIAKKELASTLKEDAGSFAREEDKKSKDDDSADNEGHKINPTCSTDPKLYVSGRFNRKKHSYKTKAFYINDGLDTEIKKYCHGTDITVYNYLISLGLDLIKQRSDMKTADATEVEDKYSK